MIYNKGGVSVRKTVRKKTKFRLFLAFIFFGIILSTLGYSFFSYMSQINEINRNKKELTMKIEALKEESEELETDIKKLEDPEYIAKYAREKYLYSKDGEYVIKLPE